MIRWNQRIEGKNERKKDCKLRTTRIKVINSINKNPSPEENSDRKIVTKLYILINGAKKKQTTQQQNGKDQKLATVRRKI